MKILTATSQTQGQRDGDFTWCVEGEVVTPFRAVCGRDRLDPDGGCGCGRSFSGLNSHKATTTAVVRDIDGYDLDDLTEAVRAYRENAGWAAITDQADELAASEARDIAETAAGYVAGTVLGIRLDTLSVR